MNQIDKAKLSSIASEYTPVVALLFVGVIMACCLLLIQPFPTNLTSFVSHVCCLFVAALVVAALTKYFPEYAWGVAALFVVFYFLYFFAFVIKSIGSAIYSKL